MSTAMKFPAEKNASFTRFHGAKQTGPANTPFYRLHVVYDAAVGIVNVCLWEPVWSRVGLG